MERRLVVFFVLSLLIWSGFLALQLVFSPPPEVAKAKPNGAEKGAVAEQGVAPDKAKQEEPAAQDPAPEEAAKKPVAPAAAPTTPRVFTTLGSLDPASGHTFLVTCDSRGGAITRIELNDPRFHDLEVPHGYLGHLELAAVEGGCRVQVVGPGTPAALAKGPNGSIGLQPGDLLTAAGGEKVRGNADLATILAATKPGDALELSLTRGAEPENLKFTATLGRQPLEVVRPDANAYATPLSPAHSWNGVGESSYRMSLVKFHQQELDPQLEELATLPSLLATNWEVATQEGTLVFRRTLHDAEGRGLELVKRFRLPKPQESDKTGLYHLEYELELRNLGDEPLEVAYRQEGPRGLPVEGWWYTTKVGPGWGAVGARDVAYFHESHQLAGGPDIISTADKLLKTNNPPIKDLLLGVEDRRLAYAAVDTQYFASGLLPGEAVAADGQGLPKFAVHSAVARPLYRVDNKYWKKTTDVSFHFDSPDITLAPRGTHTDRYVVFAGPKESEVLSHYRLDRLIEYGWFKMVSKLLGAFLHLLYYLTNNYGVAIILLTVVVRLCLLPLGLKQARSAALMQQLAPELQKIKEKYAGNMEEQGKAQRELFAKHGFNPMGGCFLMFLQLPIFIGLYRCLSVDIDLREASLLPGSDWASNLAGPDKLFNWSQWLWPYFSDPGEGWLGPYCNVFPLITIVLFIVQQKMLSPPATDEETKMQQNIMMVMTVFMGVMFYKVPAGLCIYFITSSLWGIAERKLLPQPKTLPLTSPPSNAAGPTGESKGKSDLAVPGASFMEKLLNMADNELKSSKRGNKK